MRPRFARASLAVLGALVALLVAAPAASAWRSNYWHTPTHNIHCRFFPDIGGTPVMACTTQNDDFVIAMTPERKGWTDQGSDDWPPFPAGPTLQYGDSWTARGNFRCVSQKKGVTCRSLQTRHGFFVNRASYSLW